METASNADHQTQPQAEGDGMMPRRPPVPSDVAPSLKRIQQRTPEEWQQIAESRKAHEEAMAARERQQRITEACLPELMMEHREMVFQTPACHPWQQKLELLESRIGKRCKGGVYAIVGNYGTGKSQLGAELAYRFTETTSVLFVRAQRMIVSMKDAWNSYRESVSGLMDKYIRPAILIVDEVNAGRYLDELGIEYLQEVIVSRFDARKSTLMISNETKQGFEALVGERITDRMNEDGGVVEADWPSFRSASLGGNSGSKS